MPIFKVSIFKTSFLTGNPWNFLQKTHQVRNHPTVCWTWKMQTPSCSTCFLGCTKTFYVFSKKTYQSKTSPPTTQWGYGVTKWPPTFLGSFPRLPCHDRKWHGRDFQVEISSKLFNANQPRSDLFPKQAALSWVEKLVPFLREKLGEISKKFKLTMHISLLVEVQPHPKHKQKAVFLWSNRPKVTASALWFMMYGSTSGQLRTYLYGKNNHHWNLI